MTAPRVIRLEEVRRRYKERGFNPSKCILRCDSCYEGGHEFLIEFCADQLCPACLRAAVALVEESDAV